MSSVLTFTPATARFSLIHTYGDFCGGFEDIPFMIGETGSGDKTVGSPSLRVMMLRLLVRIILALCVLSMIRTALTSESLLMRILRR